MEKNIDSNYKYLFDMTLHESKFAWDTGNIFLIANTILVGFIGATFLDLIKSPQKDGQIFLIIFATIGVIFSFLWFASLYRITVRQKYWMSRIVEFEEKYKKQLIPIFSGDSRILANGGIVKVGCEKFDLKVFGKLHIPSQSALKFIVFLYVVFYLLIILASFIILK